MEVVLLWLDDLDDLLFSGALAWERLRRTALGLGLGAAVGLAVCELGAAARWAPELAAVASGSVSLWLSAATYFALRELKTKVQRTAP